jgi:simple sugar transport system substrate-binding protein
VRGSALCLLALAVAAPAWAGCGEVVERREPDIEVRRAEPAAAPTGLDETRRGSREPKSGRLTIAVVTHGQASDPFWAVVNAGLRQAGRELDVTVRYSAPDTTDMARMRALILDAIRSRPDGLVVSIPDPGALAGAIRTAVRSGIPVVSINSGTEVAGRLGVLAHVGQADRRAGFAAGRRMARAGVRRALCIQHERENAGLAARCAGFADGLRRSGGRSRVVYINLQNATAAERRIARAAEQGRADGMLTLGPGGAEPALEALREAFLTSRVKLATFDLSPEVLDAFDAWRMEFAVDQQPFQQGYLPILLLEQYVRYRLEPPGGSLVETGPRFVTRRDVGPVRRLTEERIR